MKKRSISQHDRSQQADSKQEKVTHFRAWKSGKNWLYGASLLTALFVGTGIAELSMTPAITAQADTVSANTTDTSSSAGSSNANVMSATSSINSATSAASSALSSAAQQASSAGINVTSTTSSVTISLADGSQYASSVASSVASYESSQASSLSSEISSASSAQSSYSAASSAVSSANVKNSSAINSASSAISLTVSSANSLASSIANITTHSDLTISPSYAQVSSGATESQISSVASYNSSLYSSAVSLADSLVNSQAGSLSSAFASMKPSEVGSYTILSTPNLVGNGTLSSGFVPQLTEVDKSAPTSLAGTMTITSGTYSGAAVYATNGSSYGANWGTASSLATTGAYAVSNLDVGDSFSKKWSNIGTLNGKNVNVTMNFTVDAIQDKTKPAYMVLSNNLNTFVSSYNFNGHFTLNYSYSDGSALGLADLDQLAFLAGSITTPNEYMTTGDAKDVLLSSDQKNPTYVTLTAITASNNKSLGIPTTINTIFTSKSGGPSANDNNFNNYADNYGAAFLNITSQTPTFYFGSAKGGNITFGNVAHLLFFTESAPFNVLVSNPTVAAPTYTAVAMPDLPTAANIVTVPITVTATAPTLDAPASSTGTVKVPFDLTQAGKITGNDNGSSLNFSDVTTITVTYTPTGSTTSTTTTLPAGQTSYVPSGSGDYKITYTYMSNNGTATSTTDVPVIAPISGTGVSAWVTNGDQAVLHNVVTPSTGATLDLTAGATVVVGNITSPKGESLPALGATVVDVSNPLNIYLTNTTENGIYTFPVTYTDTSGRSITVIDTVNVSTGANTVTSVGNSVTVSNQTIGSWEGTDKNGNPVTVQPDTVKVNSVTNALTGQVLANSLVTTAGTTGNTQALDGNGNPTVTLAGMTSPGIYNVQLTYYDTSVEDENGNPEQVIVTDTIVVGQGDSKITTTAKSAEVNNELTNIIPAMPVIASDSTNPQGNKGNTVKADPAPFVTGKVGTVTNNVGSNVPAGNTADLSALQVVINANGTSTLTGFPANMAPGVYTIPVTYTYDYTDGNGPEVQTMHLIDTVTVVNGATVAVPVYTTATVKSSIPADLVNTATVNSLIDPNGNTLSSSEVTIGSDGSVTLQGQATTGLYTISIGVTDASGNATTITDVVSVNNGAQATVPVNTDTSVTNTLIALPNTPVTKAVASSTVSYTDLNGQNATTYDNSTNQIFTPDQTDGGVNFTGQPKAGIYTVTVTYTDQNGNQIPVQDVITVIPAITAEGTHNVTNTNTPITVSNTLTAKATAVTNVTVTGPDGTVPNTDVTTDTAGNVTLTGQAKPGTYTVEVTYTDGTNLSTVKDTIIVADGDETTIALGGTAVLTNPGAATLTPKTTGTLTGLGNTQNPAAGSYQVTANTDGTVTVKGLPVGDYQVPITYADASGNKVTVTDIIHVIPTAATGDETTTTVGNTGNTTLKNTPTTPNISLTPTPADPANPNSQITVTTPPGAPEVPAGDVLVTGDTTTGFTVTVPNKDLTTPGTYVINVPYTDGDGNIVKVPSTIYVSTGANTMVPTNTPASVKNTVEVPKDWTVVGTPTYTGTTPTTSSDGKNLMTGDGNVKVDTDGNVTLVNPKTPGNYDVTVTYTYVDGDGNQHKITVPDIITVYTGLGDSKAVAVNTPTSLTNTTNDSNVPLIGTPTFSNGTGPDGSFDTSKITYGPNGQVNFPGQSKTGLYVFTATYTDAAGNKVPVTDYVLVDGGDKTTVMVNTPGKVKNTLTLVPGVGVTVSNVVVGQITTDNGKTVDPKLVDVDTDGNVTLAGQPTPGIYTVPVTYTDTAGHTVTVTDVITVLGVPTLTVPSIPSTLVNTPTNVTTGVVPNDPDKLGTGKVTTTVVTDPHGKTVPVDPDGNFVPSEPGDYKVTYTYDYKTPSGRTETITGNTTVHVVTPPTLTVPSIPSTLVNTPTNVTTGVVPNDPDKLGTGKVTTVTVTDPHGKTVPVDPDGNFVPSEPGDYKVIYTYDYKTPNGQTETVTGNTTVHVVTPPTLTVPSIPSTLVNTPTNVTTGLVPNDPDKLGTGKVATVTVTDPHGKTVPVDSDGNFVPSEPGDYKVTYTYDYKTPSGQTETITGNTTVHVVTPPTLTVPSIPSTLVNTPTNVTTGVVPNDPDKLGTGKVTTVTVTDPHGKTVPVDSDGNFVPNEPGDYKVTYTYDYKTPDGRTETITGNTTVHVTTPPVVSVVPPTLTVPEIPDGKVGTPVNVGTPNITDKDKLGTGKVTTVTVTDPHGKTVPVDSDGNFVPNEPGDYKVTYTYDYKTPDGRTETITGNTTVHVTTPPVVSVVPPTLTVPEIPDGEVGTPVNVGTPNITDKDKLGTGKITTVTVTDPHGKTVPVDSDGNFVPNEPGDYKVTYTYDYKTPNGQTQTLTATTLVTVVANNLPKGTPKGSTTPSQAPSQTPLSANSAVRVLASKQSAPELPHTGDSSSALVNLLGLAAVGLGLALTLIGRRRRSND